MKLQWVLFLTSIAATTAVAQIRATEKVISVHLASVLRPAEPNTSFGKFIWAKADQQRSFRLSVPLLIQRGYTSAQSSTSGYWTGYVTTQSFKNGKAGTFYYWDVQGNLRESRLYFDINRKNKYSFKLVFPRR